MLTAKKAPAGHQRREDLPEQRPVLLARILMHDGAHPGEIGPGGESVRVEVSRHEPDAVAQSERGQARLGH
jgi:hypothetical protein